MVSASDSASTFSDTFSYNGLSQRVGKVDNTGTFSNTLDSDAIDATVLADGAATYNYGANGNALISENRGGASKYYHSDGLGSTTALTNSSESTTDTRVTDAFGNLITGSGSTPTPFGFGGQRGYQADSDTGLKLCGARYYDSSAGRFLSRDPALSGTNWYTYCGNDPVDGTDPTGLDKIGISVNPGGLGQGSHAPIYVTDPNGVTGTWYGFYPDDPGDTGSSGGSGSYGSSGRSSGGTSGSSGGSSGGSSHSLSGLGTTGPGFIQCGDTPANGATIVYIDVSPEVAKQVQKAIFARTHPSYSL